MQKAPTTKDPKTIELLQKKKSRRDRRPTVCKDQRRMYGHCGICGSPDVASQGVKWCTVCGAEKECLDHGASYWRWGSDRVCECENHWTQESGWRKGRTFVMKCILCGAVEGPTCPTCGHALWQKHTQRFCKKCGFIGDVK